MAPPQIPPHLRPPPIFSETRHGYGETNPCADFASRGRFRELYELCSQLGVTPSRVAILPEFMDTLARFLIRLSAPATTSPVGSLASWPQPPAWLHAPFAYHERPHNSPTNGDMGATYYKE
jgi:hypothetical protein